MGIGPRPLPIGKGQSRQGDVTGNRNCNGNAPVETFTAAQTRKESALANLRSLEFRQKAGELVNLAEIRNWQSHLWIPIIGALRHLPTELRDTFDMLDGREFEALLRDRIDGVLAAALAYIDDCSARGGKPVSDGSLCCGAYQVRWVIELAAEQATTPPATSPPGTSATPPPPPPAPSAPPADASPFRRRRRSQPDDGDVQ